MGSSSNSYFPAPAAPVGEQFKVVSIVLLHLPLTLGTPVPHEHTDTAEHHGEQFVSGEPHSSWAFFFDALA